MSKSDRELLELAAKAAGLQFVAMDNWPHQDNCRFWAHGDFCDCGAAWDPLTDDGDAMRLAVRLKINIEHTEKLSREPYGVTAWPVGRGECSWTEADISDYASATRRAIVRAAAAIGEGVDRGAD